jgi:6-phosphogluconolactonase
LKGETTMNAFRTAFAVAALAASFATALAEGNGQVYFETNSAAGNQVIAYSHGTNGQLVFAGAYSTGGNGTGSGLGSQGALTLSSNGSLLFAVDAGSNDVAVFKVEGQKLRLTSRFQSGGTTPISVTSNGNLVYVLNAGNGGNIAGFRARGDGQIEPIAGSSRSLSGTAVGPAQIQFSPNGDALVVTEKGTNTIDTWMVSDGLAGPLQTRPSNGATPFGFDFDNHGRLLVSEAVGGAPGASSASSYWLGNTGWTIASASTPTLQTAACWLAVSPNGQLAYTANAGSGTVSGFSIDNSGQLDLITPGGATATIGAGSHPIDMEFSKGGNYLYVLANGNGTIAEYRVNSNGSLTWIGSVSGVPTSAQGLAAG